MLKSKSILIHFVALLCAGIGFYLVYKISCFLYLPDQPGITVYHYARILWATQDGFFRFLLFINFIVKPLFIYYLVWISLVLVFERKKSP